MPEIFSSADSRFVWVCQTCQRGSPKVLGSRPAAEQSAEAHTYMCHNQAQADTARPAHEDPLSGLPHSKCGCCECLLWRRDNAHKIALAHVSGGVQFQP